MSQTAKKTKTLNPLTLNGDDLILWFDDLGTGNADNSFLSNFHEGEPITIPGVTWGALWYANFPTLGKFRDEWLKTAQDNHLPGYEQITGWDDLVEFLTGEHAFAALKFWGSHLEHFLTIVGAREINDVGDDGSLFYLSAPNHAKSLGRSRKFPIRADWEVVKYDAMLAVTRSKYAYGRAEAVALVNTGDRLLVEGTFWEDTQWGVDLNVKCEEGMWPGRNWLGSILMTRRAELRALQAAPGNLTVKNLVSNTGTYNARFSTGLFI